MKNSTQKQANEDAIEVCHAALDLMIRDARSGFLNADNAGLMSNLIQRKLIEVSWSVWRDRDRNHGSNKTNPDLPTDVLINL